MADQGRQRTNLSREVDEASRIDGSQVNSNVKSSLGDHSSMTPHLFVDFFDHLYSPWIDFMCTCSVVTLSFAFGELSDKWMTP